MIGLQHKCCKAAQVETKPRLPQVLFLHPGHLTLRREPRGRMKFEVTGKLVSERNSRGVCVDLFTVRVSFLVKLLMQTLSEPLIVVERVKDWTGRDSGDEGRQFITTKVDVISKSR